MNAYIIAMTPKRIRYLLDGKIKKEVKINCPRGSVPFKCYVYCPIKKYQTKRMHNRAMSDTGNEYDEWQGKVVAEFVCTEMRPVPKLPPLNFFDETRISSEEYERYKTRSASSMRTLTITELREYIKPRSLDRYITIKGKPVDSIKGAFTNVEEDVDETD